MSDYETAQRRRNVIVGIFVLAAMCALVWLIYKFGDLPIKVSEFGSFEVIVQFPTAQGVQKNTPVRFCGYQIGRVTKVMAPERLQDLNTGLVYHQTKVVIRIDERYADIPSHVDVKLMTRGLGSSYIEFIAEPDRPETKVLVDKMLLQGSTAMTSEFFPAESQKKLDELVDGLRTLISNANDIIGDPNSKRNIKKTLANLSEASQRASKTMEEFQKFAAAGSSTLKSADAKAEKLITTMVDTSEELGKATAQLRVILEKVNDGEGSVARLVNDGRFYENLLENTEQMEMLLQELKSFIAELRDKGVPIKLK